MNAIPARYAKADQLRRSVAESLLEIAPGSRLPTVRHLASRFGASLGATQATLARLESDGAIGTSHRGRNGAVLEQRSIGKLWVAARNDPFVLALPLPSTRQIHALATALRAALAGEGIEAYLQFIRGSRKRLAALQSNRCHAIVMSSLAAAALVGRDEAVVLELWPRSYVWEHRVAYRLDADVRDGLQRIGVDADSLDFQRLSELEFPNATSQVVGSYMRLSELPNLGEIDAMVWDVQETFATLGPGLADRPLSRATIQAVGAGNTIAALVCRAGDPAAANVGRAAMHGPEGGRMRESARGGRW